MSNITTERKLLTYINHSFTFNSKVSITVDDYLLNRETAKGGLKRKRKPENIVGTKKGKKRLRRHKFEIANHFILKLFHG